MAKKHKFDYEQMKQFVSNLEKANKRLSSAFKHDHAAFELKKSSFDVLYALYSAPEHTLTPSRLVEITHITSGSLTTRVDKLLAKNLVKKTKNAKDKRGRTITLTDKGYTLISNSLEQHKHHLESVIAPLSPKQCATLNSLLNVWLEGK